MFNLLRTGRVDFVFLNGLEARYYAGKADILSLPIKGVPRTMASVQITTFSGRRCTKVPRTTTSTSTGRATPTA